MKKTIKLTYIGAILCTVISTTACSQAKDSKSVINDVNQNVKSMTGFIEKSIKDNPKLGMSSNPYDYIKNNPYYDKLVNMGINALPMLEEKIKSESKSNIEEYIMAIAAEKISKVDLRANQLSWGTSVEWASQWDKFLKTVPKSVSDISKLNISKDEKTNRLVKLGLPAVPFIIDGIEQGNKDLIPALNELIKDNKNNIPLIEGADKSKQWIKDNKSKFDDLRKLVNDKIKS